MSLYCLQFDGEQDYVEAADMREAIVLWMEHNRVAREFDGSEEPESCALMHDGPVLRRVLSGSAPSEDTVASHEAVIPAGLNQFASDDQPNYAQKALRELSSKVLRASIAEPTKEERQEINDVWDAIDTLGRIPSHEWSEQNATHAEALERIILRGIRSGANDEKSVKGCGECGEELHEDDTGGYNPPCPCGCGCCKGCHQDNADRYEDDSDNNSRTEAAKPWIER